MAWFEATLFAASLVFCGCGPQRGTIGALLGQQPEGRLFIRETPKKLASYEAGLRPGDEILLINGVDVRTLDEKRVHEVLSGDVGSKVKLTVIRGDDVIRVTLSRTPAGRPRPQPPGPVEETPR